MAKKRFDFRMAVGSPTGPRSSVWHFWSRNDQVYVAHSDMGGIQKFSFHTPDICRFAFTKEHGSPMRLENRAMHEWHRHLTPPSETKRAVRVLRIGFATDVLSTALKPSNKNINWIKAAPAGGSTVIDIMFTRDTEEAVREAVAIDQNAQHEILVYKMLPNGEAFCVTSWFAERTPEQLRMPASRGLERDLIVLSADPTHSGRPIRLTTFSNPKDGDLMRAWEFGAYWHDPISETQWDAMCKARRA
jgi:hypothetical protein